MSEIKRENEEQITSPAAYIDFLSTVAAQNGTLSLESISRLAQFQEFDENDFIDLLKDLRNQNIDIVPDEKFLPKKDRLREMRKSLRQFDIEKENCSEQSRNEDPLRLYFSDLAQTEPLSPDEERDIIFDIADGEENKIEELIESALFIPAALAYPLAGKNMLYLDIVQEGNIELMSAAADFNYELNVSFYAYAAFRVLRYLLTLVDEEELPQKIPAILAKDASDYLSEKKRFFDENGREPTESELSELLKIPEERISAVRDVLAELNKKPESENQPESNGDTKEVPSDAEKQLSRQVADLIAALPALESKVITMRYGIGFEHAMETEEIAKILGITAEKVKQLEKDAMKHLGN